MVLKANGVEIRSLATAVERLISSVPKSKRVLRRFEERVRRREEAYWSPAELLVAAALVNQVRYKAVVVPRMKRFRARYPRVKSVVQLHELLRSKPDVYIYKQVLNFGTGRSPKNYRAPLLRGLANSFHEYGRKIKSNGRKMTDYEVLRAWAREADPLVALQQANGGKIRGLGPKLVDWLRMFGGDVPTVPNDVYTIQGMKKLGLDETGKTAAFIARLFGLSPYTLDVAFRP
jgi:hypothetical protein